MTPRRPIYLDCHATTPVDPRVLEAMLPYFTEKFGNAASRSHRFGWEAEEAVERARAQVASLIGAEPKDVLFTSGATESDNIAIKGLLAAWRERAKEAAAGDTPLPHFVTTAVEHRAVLDTLAKLARRGEASLTVVPVRATGHVDPSAVAEALRDETLLVSVMAANNEVGSVMPLAACSAVTRARGVLLHTDAAQALGKIPFDVRALGVDLASFSAHKVYGPKGVGALYVRRSGTPRVRLEALCEGGGQERGLRSGTVPVPLVVGFGEACAVAESDLHDEMKRLAALRERLLQGLTAKLEAVQVNGSLADRLPGNLNVSFEGIEGEALLTALKHVAVSSGSACTSGTVEPSYVLKALGVTNEQALTAIRFGIGRFNTEDEIDHAIEEVASAVTRLRSLSPVWEMKRAGIDPATAWKAPEGPGR